MTTQDIYVRYYTPGNLQRHMLDVAGMVSIIKEYWLGDAVDWNVVVSAALLHDLGNIVKFDFDKYPHLLGSEQSRIEHWRNVQRDTIMKYGSNDHVATDAMLQETGVAENVRQVIANKSFGNSIQLRDTGDIESKLLLYCDLRVLPSGIGRLSERLDDIKKRLTKYSERPDFDQLTEACYDIEKEIKISVSIDLDAEISNSIAETFTKGLPKYEI